MPIATSNNGSKIGFLHIPKCAGTSLEHSLGVAEEYPDIGVKVTITKPHNERLFGGGLQHLTGREILRNHEARWTETDVTFAVIRHPLDRLISHLFWRVSRFEGFEGTEDKLLSILKDIVQEVEGLAKQNGSFNDPFQGYEYDHTAFGALELNNPQRHLLPQAAFLFSKGKVVVDRIYLLNNLPHLEQFLSSKGFLDRPLAHRMKRYSHQNFINTVSGTLKERVEFLYRADYQIFDLVTALSRAQEGGYAPGRKIEVVQSTFLPTITHPTKQVPRKLWMYWGQGLKQAPALVKDCIQSWIDLNPDWQVNVLGCDNLKDYIVLPDFYITSKEITPTSFSDIVRIYLLEKQGGVWADATTWCMRPLDEWINQATAAAGFFAFSRPENFRPLGSWFLAAHNNNKIVFKWKQAVDLLWYKYCTHSGPSIFESLFRGDYLRVLNKTFADHLDLPRWERKKYCEKVEQKGLNNFLTSDPESKYYFWFQTLFAALLEIDAECSSLWEKVVKASAIEPHFLQREGVHSSLSSESRQHIENVVCNVYKLDRRAPVPEQEKGTIWGFLKQRHQEILQRRL